MDLRIPKVPALVTLALALLAIAIFVYLMGRFGGPELTFEERFELTTTVPDSEGISKKSDVLVHGVDVGEVTAVRTRGDGAEIRFEVDDRYRELVRRDATVRIGDKTLLGEAYVDLRPGSRAAPAIAADASVRGVASTELDQALEPLARQGGRAMRSLLRTTGRGARDERTSARLSATVGELSVLVDELHGLTGTLRGQSRTIAAGVTDTRTVLAELGERQGQVRTIVSAGRATLGALAARRAALEAGVTELPRLLHTSRETLRRADPLLREARPLLADLRAAAPALTPALRDLRPVARDARRAIADLPAFNRAALPFLARAEPAVARARPLARGLDPLLRNLAPALGYLEPRKQTLISWFSNTYGIRSDNPDEVGEWARFLLFLEDKTAFGQRCTPPACKDFLYNPYAPRDDEPRLAPYQRGSYPRLQPLAAESPARGR